MTFAFDILYFHTCIKWRVTRLRSYWAVFCILLCGNEMATVDEELVKIIITSFALLGLDDSKVNKVCLDVYEEHFKANLLNSFQDLIFLNLLVQYSIYKLNTRYKHLHALNLASWTKCLLIFCISARVLMVFDQQIFLITMTSYTFLTSRVQRHFTSMLS
jgi:hypothetical protein